MEEDRDVTRGTIPGRDDTVTPPSTSRITRDSVDFHPAHLLEPVPAMATHELLIPKVDPPPGSSPSSATTHHDDKHRHEKASAAEDGLAQAKDRAQITAATSMSIVHVALLKNTLEVGRSGMKYYDMILGFIISALVIQLLAGLLALYISLLRHYYKKYKDDFLGDCAHICCPVSCQRRKRKHETFDSWFEAEEKSKHRAREDSDEESLDCCPCECIINRFDDFDYRILDLYEIWSEKAIKTSVAHADIDAEMNSLTEDVNKARSELSEWEALNDEHGPGVGDDDMLRAIRERLEHAQQTREKLEEKRRQANRLKAQGKVLQEYVKDIEKERVSKSATFWQNNLNVLLYIVFVLNSFIVGFGLANGQNEN